MCVVVCVCIYITTMQEEQRKLLDAGIRLKDDCLELEMQDLANVFDSLALSTRKRLTRFVGLSRKVSNVFGPPLINVFCRHERFVGLSRKVSSKLLSKPRLQRFVELLQKVSCLQNTLTRGGVKIFDPFCLYNVKEVSCLQNTF